MDFTLDKKHQMARDLFKEFAEIDDRLILSCFEKGDSHPFGFLIIIEYEDSKDKILFHGGTWKHERRYSLLAYEGLYKAIHFLVNKGFVILTSCHRNNTKADLLQKRFGFVEYKTDDEKALEAALSGDDAVKNYSMMCYDSATRT